MVLEKTTKPVLTLCLSLLIIAAAPGCGSDAGTVAAHRKHLQERHKKLSKRLDRVLNRIDATDAQRDKIHRIKNDLLKSAMSLHKEKHSAGKVALEQWQSASPDRQLLVREVDRQVELFRAFAHLAVDRAIEVHGTLTPEQRAEVVELIGKVRRMHRMWHGH